MIIEVENLRKTYQTYHRGGGFLETAKSLIHRKAELVEAVKDVSFSVEEGELLGFIGPNGAGKSTTLKMLTGILYPTSGHASILGYVPWKERKKYVANIGAVFGQKSQLIWDVPPIDAFLLNKAIYNLNSVDFSETLEQMTALLDISEVIHKPTRQLSLGERMKCEFVMAMLHRPPIVFLDEPTIGLDVIAKDAIRGFVQEQNRKGTTFIMTTHDIGDIEQLARRVIIVNHGQIAFDDSLEMLRGKTGSQKKVKAATIRPIAASDGFPEGIQHKQALSQFETEFIIDLNKSDMGSFISYTNEQYGIKDMKVEEIAIEAVIKKLYQ